MDYHVGFLKKKSYFHQGEITLSKKVRCLRSSFNSLTIQVNSVVTILPDTFDFIMIQSETISPLLLCAVIWPTYYRYGVKHYIINQSSIFYCVSDTLISSLL